MFPIQRTAHSYCIPITFEYKEVQESWYEENIASSITLGIFVLLFLSLGRCSNSN